jgi:surface protein
MFFNARDFNRNIGNWNTSNVTDMSEMFGVDAAGANPIFFNQNIGNWDTSSVTNMAGMFRGAKFFNQNIGNWNTSNVTNMSDMFRKANAFNQNIGNWDVSQVTDMSGMFANDLFNEPEDYAFANGGSLSIENWNTSNVVDMSGMFLRANNFNFSLENWDLNPNVILTTMLDRCGLDCVNYSKTLLGWSNNSTTPNNKILGATFMEYGPSAVNAVENLTTNKSWLFSGHDINSDVPEFELESSYCSGTDIPALPLVSENGIQGTWSPALNNIETTTYFFTPDAGQCGSTANVTLTITPNEQPVFEQIAAICAGANVPVLPTTSTNGISGTWSPAINNMETTTYTFTPNIDNCSTASTMTITVNQNTATTPSGETVQTFETGATIASLLVSPADVIWFANNADALANSNPLDANEPLEDGVTYFAVNTNETCSSVPFAVTVSILLSNDVIDLQALKIYPNPAQSSVQINYNQPIHSVAIYSMMGQLVMRNEYNANQVNIDIQNLPASMYLVIIKSENETGEFKLLKK